MSNGVVRISGSFTGTGQSVTGEVFGMFNIALWGTFSATVAVERSLDGGSNWIAVATDPTGTAASYTVPVSLSGLEPEDGALYRFNCTGFVSGTVNYRLSQVGDFAISLARQV